MALADEEGYPHAGRINFVDNQLRVGAGTIRLRAVFDNTDGSYTPGLYVRLRLQSGQPRPRVLVDDRAIGTDLGKKFVFIVGKDHKIAYRQVDVGPIFSGLRVINAGLRADDLIVINGVQRARPGIEVKPVRVAMTAWLDEADRKYLADTAAADAPAQIASVDAMQSR
jgi:RND family efflux transporter MFP subunit